MERFDFWCRFGWVTAFLKEKSDRMILSFQFHDTGKSTDRVSTILRLAAHMVDTAAPRVDLTVNVGNEVIEFFDDYAKNMDVAVAWLSGVFSRLLSGNKHL